MTKDNSKKRASANSGKRQRRVLAGASAAYWQAPAPTPTHPDSNQQE